ncbi:MAG: protein kinase [Myxococcales bacterium]|nr:protein kinase [Myxococcales bacterium]
MTAALRIDPGDRIADKYRVERTLGKGGMGVVLLAHHELTGRRVALKVVPTGDPVVRERLLREARSMGRLSHPNVVGVLDMGLIDGAVFLAMEYVHGESLRSHTDAEPLAVGVAIDLLLPACAGVAAAHQAGILHRDLKPENLFVCTDRDGTALTTKVLDFGVAKHLDDGNVDTSLTDQGSIVGTPKYMAPEQLGGDRALDERTDVYALGLILYELLVGQLPYDATGLRKVVWEILRGGFTPVCKRRPEVPAALSEQVMRALEPEREARHASVAEFARAIEPWAASRRYMAPREIHTPGDLTLRPLPGEREPPCESGEAPTMPLPIATPPQEWPSQQQLQTTLHSNPAPDSEKPRRWLWPALALAVLALAALVWTLGRREDTPEPAAAQEPTRSGEQAPKPEVEPTPGPVASPAEEAVTGSGPNPPSQAQAAEAAPTTPPTPPQPVIQRAPKKRPPRRAAALPQAPSPKASPDTAPAQPTEPRRPHTDNRDPWAGE